MTYRDLLRIPGFRAFFIGQSISLVGDAFYYVVFMFMVGEITGSAAMVGFVGALEMVPFLLLSPYAGIIADRIDRRKILLATALASGTILFVFLGVVLSNQTVPLWTLFATAFLTSVVTTFLGPAKNAAIPSLVPAEGLLAANALNGISANITPVFSHFFTATVLAVLYKLSPQYFFAAVVALNVLSFYWSAYFFLRMPPCVPDRVVESHAMEDLREGIAYLKSRLDLKVLVTAQGLLSLFVSPFFVVYIAVNKAWFDGTPMVLAICEGGFFVGMVVASALVGKANVRRPGLAFVGSTLIVGVTVVFMGYSPVLWQFVVWNFLAGLAVPFAQIPMQTYLQLSVPDGFRGRVNSVLMMVNLGVMPLGMSTAGIMLDAIGIVASFWVMGLGMAVAAAFGWAFAEFRNATIAGTPVQDSE